MSALMEEFTDRQRNRYLIKRNYRHYNWLLKINQRKTLKARAIYKDEIKRGEFKCSS